MEIKEQKRRAVLLARYHTLTPKPSSTAYGTYAAISKQLNVRYCTVRAICLQCLEPR